MKFECPDCKKSGQIDDSDIPESGVYATCQQCGNKFIVKRAAPKDFVYEPVEQSVAKNTTKVNLFTCKAMRYMYASVACFFVIMFAGSIKRLLGWGPIEGGAIPALIISSAIFMTWYIVTKSDRFWCSYLIAISFMSIVGTVIVSNIITGRASEAPYDNREAAEAPKPSEAPDINEERATEAPKPGEAPYDKDELRAKIRATEAPKPGESLLFRDSNE